MGRPRRQDTRRTQIVEAAVKAIVARGYERVRIKDIAAEAGVSSQTVLYYFPDVEALLLETLSRLIHRFVEMRRDTADAVGDPVSQLAATIWAGLPAGPDDEIAVIYVSLGSIRRNPALRALSRALTEQQVELYRRILEAGSARGAFELRESSLVIAENLVALEDAYGLYIIEGDPITPEHAISRIATYAAAAVGVVYEDLLPASGGSRPADAL